MRTRMTTIALATAVSMTMATGAMAAPPHGDGAGAHTHHVNTGDGGCVDVDAVRFLPEDHGLHRGADSSGVEQGIWHGPCN